eukprot:8588682-Pyramimonas_sp.AAC.1
MSNLETREAELLAAGRTADEVAARREAIAISKAIELSLLQVRAHAIGSHTGYIPPPSRCEWFSRRVYTASLSLRLVLTPGIYRLPLAANGSHA